MNAKIVALFPPSPNTDAMQVRWMRSTLEVIADGAEDAQDIAGYFLAAIDQGKLPEWDAEMRRWIAKNKAEVVG